MAENIFYQIFKTPSATTRQHEDPHNQLCQVHSQGVRCVDGVLPAQIPELRAGAGGTGLPAGFYHKCAGQS